MSDPNNVPLPQQPEANGTPTPNPVPQYGAPAPAQPSQPALYFVKSVFRV
ncbi:hypothetical protein AAAX09_09950 [Bifidobacterium longum]